MPSRASTITVSGGLVLLPPLSSLQTNKALTLLKNDALPVFPGVFLICNAATGLFVLMPRLPVI